MKKREFITLLGGAAAWPVVARAQQAVVPVIGILMTLGADDPQGRARLDAFRQGLKDSGWVDGDNIRLEYRTDRGANRLLIRAKALLALNPSVFLAAAPPAVIALREVTRTVPIVFAQVPDPVGLGFATSMAHPAGNITGFSLFDFPIAGKWLELLTQLSAQITNVAVIYDPASSSWARYLSAVESTAKTFKVSLSTWPVRNAEEIKKATEDVAKKPNSGLVVLPGPGTSAQRRLIVDLAAKHLLPAVYAYRYFSESGGLVSYGVDNIATYGRAASYIDRILKGEKPADLPVQAPTKYELVINLKTAKALGLEVPPMLLARADEVIE
jgi:putative ABC transport system substrate-binding protein